MAAAGFSIGEYAALVFAGAIDYAEGIVKKTSLLLNITLYFFLYLLICTPPLFSNREI